MNSAACGCEMGCWHCKPARPESHIERECAVLGHEWACDHENDPPTCIHCGAEGAIKVPDYRRETWATKDIEALLALLDDSRLRQALGYLEDCAADEIWQPLRAWIEDRDHILKRVGAQ